MSRKIFGIMAVTPEGIIGNESKLPWNYPEELEWVRNITKDSIIIVGRKTFELMPAVFFKRRMPIIFSRGNFVKKTSFYKVVRCLPEFLILLESFSEGKIFMIGGAQIAHLFLSAGLISEFFLTKIHKSYKGDTYLNLYFFEGWHKVFLCMTSDYSIYKLQKSK